jgi:hypothetical protein
MEGSFKNKTNANETSPCAGCCGIRDASYYSALEVLVAIDILMLKEVVP